MCFVTVMQHCFGPKSPMLLPRYTHINECTRFPEPLYPMISLFRNMSVRANFGPDFLHPPKLDEKFNPMAYAAAPASVFSTVQERDLAVKKKKVEPLLNNMNINVELMAQSATVKTETVIEKQATS